MKRFALLCALLLPTVAGADPWQPPAHRSPSRPEHGMQPRISMGDAMAMVQRAFGGRVMQAQPASVNGQPGYRIKILTAHGEVRIVHVDGETGAMQ